MSSPRTHCNKAAGASEEEGLSISIVGMGTPVASSVCLVSSSDDRDGSDTVPDDEG